MLNQKEIRQLVVLLKKIDTPHDGLPQPVFDALSALMPFVACELAVISPKGILLTWRSDKWWRGWHFPGGLLRYRESFEKRIQAVAREELGVNVISYKFMFAKDCSQGARGHVVSLIFRCEIAMTPKHGKYFRKKPKNIIGEHEELWKKVQKF